MTIFDLHQDLMTHIRFRDAMKQSPQTDFASITSSDIDLVIATAFPLPENENHTDDSVPGLITEELQMYHDYLDTHDNWTLVKSAADIASNKQKILLHIEGLNTFTGSPDSWKQLLDWVESGVRSVGTHWNIENQLGGGTLQPNTPLTRLGAEVITFLEENSVLFDMAHMGRQTFWDTTKIMSRPLYVSHGNADGVFPHVRNYTDEQLTAIAKSDGVIGVFFAGSFVSDADVVTIDNVVTHFIYLKKLIGIRHIAIGSDFGGIVTKAVNGLSHVEQLPALITALEEAGFSATEIDAITHKNAQRILTAHLA